MEKKHTLPKALGIIVAGAIVLLIAKCALAGGLPGHFQADSSHEASIVEFLNSHPELGKMKFPFVEETSDWAEGKRMWVYTDRGTYLVYFLDTDIKTVYLQMEDGTRIEIYRAERQ